MKCVFVPAVLFALLLVPTAVKAADPQETVQSAIQVLDEVMSSPGKGIPASLLKDAEGVAVIPGMIRVGAIAGVRRGKGVVVVREADGGWALPQFVTLGGGNLGFQIGAESSDVVLVFKTKRSVANLMDGKFTIGTDAGAAAGPVGRRVEAATDVQLKAEIYSYSRSRGLFAGISLDGSRMQLDPEAWRAYYGVDGKAPPQSAVQLVELLAGLVERGDAKEEPAGSTAQPGDAKAQPGDLKAQPGASKAQPARPMGALGVSAPPKEVRGAIDFHSRPQAPQDVRELRRQLAEASMRLQAKLDETWSAYLALPAEVFEGKDPNASALGQPLKNFAAVAQDGRYRALAELVEFQRTYDLLKRYSARLTPAAAPKLSLPPPPGR
jgi:lipid-binding SYLF domain-containing protein